MAVRNLWIPDLALARKAGSVSRLIKRTGPLGMVKVLSRKPRLSVLLRFWNVPVGRKGSIFRWEPAKDPSYEREMAMLERCRMRWRQLIAKHHPDRGGCTETCATINYFWDRTQELFKRRGIQL